MARSTFGFTLIELLVVMAVIAVLGAIIFPVFGVARERARLAACASNLRQIGMAAMLYSQDHDEAFPVGDTPHNPQLRLLRALEPYTRNPGIFYCPSAAAAGEDDLKNTQANWEAGNISYLYWSYDAFNDRDSAGFPKWLPAPKRIVTQRWESDTWLASDWWKRNKPSPHHITDRLMNYVCLDGHVDIVISNPKHRFK